MSEQLLDIVIDGPGPYGFRLYGGDGDPLIVAKLRSRSKAHDAGLRENDVIVGINGRSCQTIGHGVAMTLLESADQSLHLHLYRGSKDEASILSAYESLGHQLRPVSPGTLPPNRSIYSIQPSPAVQPSAQPPANVSQVLIEPAAEPQSAYSRQEVTSSVEGGVTQTVTTETKDLGGVTLTKVTRHVITGNVERAGKEEPADRHQDVKHSAVFHVPKFKVTPLVWTPEGSAPAEAGTGRFQVNKTITFDLSPVDGKENRAPEFVKVPEDQPKFKVHKTSAKAWVWQPDHVTDLPAREQSPAMKFDVIETRDQPQQQQQQQLLQVTVGAGGEEEDEDARGRGLTDDNDPFSLTPALIRVLTTEGPEDDLAFLKRKKKKVPTATLR